jgi:hypothetical protein
MFIGVDGIVHEIHANERGIAVLNRYVVLFKWGETKTFYEAQLDLLAAA